MDMQIKLDEPVGEKLKISLTDAIRTAKSKAEIEELLVKGTTFKNVDPRTARKWDRAAQCRLASLPAVNDNKKELQHA